MPRTVLLRNREMHMDSLEGQFLIAAPQCTDTNFSKSVVLIVQHDSNGAFGIILNHRSDVKLQDMWSRMDDSECASDAFMSIGGPVDGPVLVLHTVASHSESEIIPGVHIASERDNIRYIVLNQLEPFRVFSGYSGWGNGQLETEIQLGGWITLAASAPLIFEDDVSELWQKTINRAGRDFLEGTLGIDQFPSKPDLN